MTDENKPTGGVSGYRIATIYTDCRITHGYLMPAEYGRPRPPLVARPGCDCDACKAAAGPVVEAVRP